jgi:hypothetical protein
MARAAEVTSMGAPKVVITENSRTPPKAVASSKLALHDREFPAAYAAAA